MFFGGGGNGGRGSVAIVSDFFTKNPNLKKKLRWGEDGLGNRIFLQRIQNVKKKRKNIFFVFCVRGVGGGAGGMCFLFTKNRNLHIFLAGWNGRGSVARRLCG